MSEFTSHPRCLEARHAMLAENLGLVEDLSALREVRPSPVIRHFGGRLTCLFITFWITGAHERRQGSSMAATKTALCARW